MVRTGSVWLDGGGDKHSHVQCQVGLCLGLWTLVQGQNLYLRVHNDMQLGSGELRLSLSVLV